MPLICRSQNAIDVCPRVVTFCFIIEPLSCRFPNQFGTFFRNFLPLPHLLRFDPAGFAEFLNPISGGADTEASLLCNVTDEGITKQIFRPCSLNQALRRSHMFDTAGLILSISFANP